MTTIIQDLGVSTTAGLESHTNRISKRERRPFAIFLTFTHQNHSIMWKAKRQILLCVICIRVASNS